MITCMRYLWLTCSLDYWVSGLPADLVVIFMHGASHVEDLLVIAFALLLRVAHFLK